MSHYLTLEKMSQMVPGSRLLNVSSAMMHSPIDNLSTDSRKIQSGDFFIAIAGEKFDGNQFLKEVCKKGSLAALASKEECVPENFPVLLVEDTLKALQMIATAWRKELNPQLILVTGSNGKTTVKEMIASILKEALGEKHVLATPGNLNNDIGLPLTLLGLRAHHQIAVIELGMNHPGETQFLASIAQPNIVLINNAQREHQEFMHTVEAVALEHADAISQLQENGVAIFPADSEYTEIWKSKSNGYTYLDFSLSENLKESLGQVVGCWKSQSHLRIELPENKQHPKTGIEVKLATLGDHNAKNAIAAATVAFAANINHEAICRGLEKFMPVAGRMRSHSLPSFGELGQLVDDTYNANPDSVIAAIDVLAQLPGTRWLVLGDMGEVGNQGQQFHHEIGKYAKDKGIEHLYATGELSTYAIEGFKTQIQAQPLAKEAQGIHFHEPKALLKQLKADLQTFQHHFSTGHVAILVKGSRFTKMERIVNCLLKEESLCF
ncbi:UDP-N-acetylmuramoyl-tripeptide--D-alanyl-D-alanine ligase [Polynucleobacter sp. SHI8]|uniref:UDP-N-acetylmuramoyl-tripeptide--D-alanyl-D- alanine ligase n=1 Tax=unclassified Polynucleobacter TaxID=2640945 RepID=UPI0024937543|nr:MULTISPECIES: UDP-N-acetylmuramoyl-tripeptide--D-alanyl-D-alanine ligase [unclassified Polynucleobacter]BDW10095.1 UDP-N-acetylmuramoyl-tripeptide--D-alanyl-D-alanine ligase [Polynucleobacter sp. SHI2]BDW12541.1 UDP-N-acetylmuramoyl-tripeptide--D-alanyl-D-alanine ligase [Polynucleobacter sp. SHI8]